MVMKGGSKREEEEEEMQEEEEERERWGSLGGGGLRAFEAGSDSEEGEDDEEAAKMVRAGPRSPLLAPNRRKLPNRRNQRLSSVATNASLSSHPDAMSKGGCHLSPRPLAPRPPPLSHSLLPRVSFLSCR